MFLIINAVNTTAKTFRVLGNVAGTLLVNSYIQVLKSTGNNGIYKLAAVTYANGYTTLTTVEPIPSSVADGNIAGGVYELKFSDATVPGKAPLIVAPWSTNNSTSLTLNGKAVLNFGEHQQQNLLMLLENFASPTAPVNPTIGQQWFDTSAMAMKVYIGSGWVANADAAVSQTQFLLALHL